MVVGEQIVKTDHKENLKLEVSDKGPPVKSGFETEYVSKVTVAGVH